MSEYLEGVFSYFFLVPSEGFRIYRVFPFFLFISIINCITYMTRNYCSNGIRIAIDINQISCAISLSQPISQYGNRARQLPVEIFSFVIFSSLREFGQSLDLYIFQMKDHNSEKAEESVRFAGMALT